MTKTTQSVKLIYSQKRCEYIPTVIETDEPGSTHMWWVVRDYPKLGTNAILPAIVRARELAERLGLPCQE